MTLSDQPEVGVSAPSTSKPSVDPLGGSPAAEVSADDATTVDQAAGAAQVISNVAPYDPTQTSLDMLGEDAGATVLGLSPRQAQLLGLVAALAAAAGGAVFVRNRRRQRRRATVRQRLQDRLYLSVSRLIAATLVTAGPLRDRQAPGLARLSPLLVEAILRRKTGATPLLLARASRVLTPRQRR